jgi:hypothetical protein
MVDGFLLGVIVTAAAVTGAYFLKFWRQTRDTLFLAFGISFLIEAVNRTSFLFLANPNEGNPIIYSIRLFSYVLILGAIVNKNRR